MSTVPARADIPQSDTWNHESVFATFDAWRDEYAAVADKLPDIDAFKGTLAQGPQRLAEWFDLQQAIARRVWTLYMYAQMWQACDGENEEIKGMLGQAQGLAGSFMSATAFAQPELLDMDPGELLQWTQSEPVMQLYEHYVDNLLRTKDHVLSAEVESVLGLLNDPLGRIESIRGALNDMDLQFDDAMDSGGAPQPLVRSTRDKLLADNDRQTRQSAWQNYADSYLRFHNTFASAYLASVKANVARARLRGYDSVLHAKLSPSNIPLEVFQNLIDTCTRNFPTASTLGTSGRP